MNCKEFLENYSDYLDRRLEVFPLSEYGDHLTNCVACADYDRVVQSGLRLVGEIEPKQTGPDFEPRLQHRFFHLHDSMERREAVARAAAVAMLSAAVLVAAIFVPALAARSAKVELPPVVVEMPERPRAAMPASFFGLSSSVVPTVSPLVAPDFSEASLLSGDTGRLSLFQAPLKVTPDRSEPAAESEAAE